MKGSEYFLMATVIGAFAFMALIAGGAVFIIQSASKTQVLEVRTSEELRVTSAAYIIERCLGDGDYLLNSSLTGKKGKILDLCRIDFGAKVEDLESKEEWDFGYKEDAKTKRSIFVNIKYPGEVHIGRLHVSA